MRLTEKLREEYNHLWDTCEIKKQFLPVADHTADRIEAYQEHYKAVSKALGYKVPWQYIAMTHKMESNMSFNHHLHNGDLLTHRTVRVPKGRPIASPANGSAYTWNESAIDAMQTSARHTDWSIAGILYRLEAYNGFGYRLYHPTVLSPYLWSYTNHYTKGRYVSDGKFDATAKTKQIGCAAILKELENRGLYQVGIVKPEGPTLTYSLDYVHSAVELQEWLNTFHKQSLKTDGKPGPKTSQAFYNVFGHYLMGDPREGV